jgi:hypothetical protein
MLARADSPDPAEVPLDFDPDRPTGWSPSWNHDVTLVPWGAEEPRGAKRAAGVFNANGGLLEDGHCYRYAGGRITVAPDPEPAVEHLEGSWLFGGIFYGHFGHFLCETTSRLWATDLLGDFDGIVFYPKQRLTHEARQFRHQRPFFEALDLADKTIRAPQVPVRIDRLALPPPAFGIGELIAGRPEYRAFMRARLGDGVAADGAEDIYVSRARLPSKRGAILLETRIEALMQAAGYTVFHPQDHDLQGQIARWKAARRIVSLDGSALHLAAMLVQPGTKVAILNRGPSHNIEDYIRQFRAFAGIEPTRIDAVAAFYHRADRRVVKRETHAVLDLPAIGAALADAGFVSTSHPWPALDAAELAEAAHALGERIGAPLQRHEV